jgi:hypothetical protein
VVITTGAVLQAPAPGYPAGTGEDRGQRLSIPLDVGVTLHNLAAGHLRARLRRTCRELQPYTVTVCS